MKRSLKAQKIGLILDKLYPETPTPLDHYSAYTLLVAVMLSAQTTDKKVNQVTPALFRKADTPEAMSKLDVKTIQNLIKEIGLAPTKAKEFKKNGSSINWRKWSKSRLGLFRKFSWRWTQNSKCCNVPMV